jgi:glucokinase
MTNDHQIVLCVDIGGHQHATALVEVLGDGARVLDAERTRTELRAEAAAIAENVVRQAETLRLRRPQEFARVRSAGVGFGGPVQGNRPWRSMHVAGWDGLDLCGRLTERFGVPAVMGNDGDLGALGENRFGAGRGTRSMAYLTVSTGIGGGIILDGRLWRGSHGFAAELGHIRIRSGPDAPTCSCGGVGCLEACCSGTSLGRIARQAVASGPGRFAGLLSLPEVAGKAEAIDARAVFRAVGAGDEGAKGLLDRYLDDLARGLGSIINTLDPELIVIGGGVSKAGDALFVPLRERVRGVVMPMTRNVFRVEPAQLGESTVLVGAAALAVSGGN